ncbi:hypothetical protein KJ596_03865 [Patescibacteria group bacterium]|nr:hypothetical protein [Patescibacteria group bacterium]MBU1868079.1 hypothetical protein [Patescibacteria group bacterium]
MTGSQQRAGVEAGVPSETTAPVETDETRIQRLLGDGVIRVTPVTLLDHEGNFYDGRGVLGTEDKRSQVSMEAVYRREPVKDPETNGKPVQAVLVYTHDEDGKPVPLAVVEGRPDNFRPEILVQDGLIVKAIQETHLTPKSAAEVATPAEEIVPAPQEETVAETEVANQEEGKRLTDNVEVAERQAQGLADTLTNLRERIAQLPPEAQLIFSEMLASLDQNLVDTLDQERIPVEDFTALRAESDRIQGQLRPWERLSRLNDAISGIPRISFQAGLQSAVTSAQKALLAEDPASAELLEKAEEAVASALEDYDTFLMREERHGGRLTDSEEKRLKEKKRRKSEH